MVSEGGQHFRSVKRFGNRKVEVLERDLSSYPTYQASGVTSELLVIQTLRSVNFFRLRDQSSFPVVPDIESLLP